MGLVIAFRLQGGGGGISEEGGLQLAQEEVDVSPSIWQLCLGALRRLLHHDVTITANAGELDAETAQHIKEATIFHAMALHLLDDARLAYEWTIGHHHRIVLGSQFGIVLAHNLDVVGMGSTLFDAYLITVDLLIGNLGVAQHIVKILRLTVEREEMGIANHLLSLGLEIRILIFTPPF